MTIDWHKAKLDEIIRRRESMPHALLISGPAGIGKYEFASMLAQALLCQSPVESGRACGQCRACQMIAAQTHPDLLNVGLEKNNDDKLAKEIKIDQIRSLCSGLVQTSQFGGYKVAIINPAERMNRNAANSLLKTLEEPVPMTILILVSSRLSRLPATIRSRCQQLKLQQPSTQQVKQWLHAQYPEADADALLAAANGSPKIAAHIAGEGLLQSRHALFNDFVDIGAQRKDPLAVAAQWQKQADEQWFQWLLSWTDDMIRLKLNTDAIVNKDLQKSLHVLTKRIDLNHLFDLRAKLQRALGLAVSSVNMQLLVESIFIAWANVAANRISTQLT